MVCVLDLFIFVDASYNSYPASNLGGLLVDLGLLTLKPDTLQRGIARCREKATSVDGNYLPMFEGGDPAIVEWRALTVIYLDLIADELRREFKLNKETLTLAQVLEGGTWSVSWLRRQLEWSVM